MLLNGAVDQHYKHLKQEFVLFSHIARTDHPDNDLLLFFGVTTSASGTLKQAVIRACLKIKKPPAQTNAHTHILCLGQNIFFKFLDNFPHAQQNAAGSKYSSLNIYQVLGIYQCLVSKYSIKRNPHGPGLVYHHSSPRTMMFYDTSKHQASKRVHSMVRQR